MKFFERYTGFLRGLRISYWLYNLSRYARLKNNANLYKQFGVKKPVWQSISHADITQPSQERPWLDQDDITTENIKQASGFNKFSVGVQQAILEWPQKGFMILPAFFSNQETDAVNEEVAALLEAKAIDFNFTGVKLMDAWKESAAVTHIFRQQKLLEILTFLLGKEVVPFQTINFVKGSGQRPHSDSIHMTTEPLGYLVATWTALEDVQDGAGQLVYYPGSHRLPYIMSEHYNTGNSLWQLGADNYPNYEEKIAEVLRENKLEPHYFKAKKGDTLIWHANLLHGGSPITNQQSTRRSLVAHYYGKGVLCYHELSQRPAII